ncbi:pentatricopeptide repeat-containing protein At2g13600-like [Juglans microcarpa x Juglans regia]|uniref:pentatricopeptide repeat-containing protein At2g13600-like n=1 Tax=Juglans microcarpa x Juglans regia TaxID=2249226 RepID=UPI001B7F2A0D|nr:pentatricopeptide repeat-containing protein At2g13600-like [Juglans microcarpa x Juglans regia]
MIREAIGSLLHHCSKTKAFRHGLSLHAAAFKTALQFDIIIANHILNMYAKCGNIVSARRVFDEMSERNLVSWSAMISGCDQVGEHPMALELFSKMRPAPNEYVFASAISASASLMAMPQGQQLHAKSLKFGYASVSFVCNSLISMYMKCGRCNDALSVYTSTPEPNSVSCNALISGFVDNGQLERGFEVFKLMHQQGFVPDRFTFVGALEICTDSNDCVMGTALHAQTVKLELDSTPFIGNVMISMYSRFSLIDEAEKVFRLIKLKDVISWNTIIAAYSHCDEHSKGLSVFKGMANDYYVRPDDFTFASVLAACASLASIRHGKQIHAHIIRTRLYQDVGVGNALVNMYAKCGSIGCAHNVFNRIHHRNNFSWNTMIAGFANHGLGEWALDLFEQMKAMGLNPDSVTFVGLLMACNHAGLVDKGEVLFNSMEKDYGITPDIQHFSCFIDMLGRAGRLRTAEEYIKKFPFGHDPVVLGSLLSACRLHGDIVIGEWLAKQLLKTQPVTSSPYVLLANLYALDEMWGDVAEARNMLKGSGLRKTPGHSLIEVNGNFEKFTIGDFSHTRIHGIKNILRTLNWAVREVFLAI